MLARGEFRHHAAVFGMQGDLRSRLRWTNSGASRTMAALVSSQEVSTAKMVIRQAAVISLYRAPFCGPGHFGVQQDAFQQILRAGELCVLDGLQPARGS